jgi:hypothetical protein
VSNVKGGYHVAATLMIESLESMQLRVAKNSAFNREGKKFLEQVQYFLRQIAKTSSKITQ